MNQNSLIEVGSKVNIVLRFKAPIELNGKSYAAGEPYLFLKECSAIISYSNQDKTGKTDKTEIANSSIKPREVIVGGVSFSRKLASLLATYTNTATNYSTTQFKYLIADDDHAIYLTEDIELDESNQPVGMFVYNSSFEEIGYTTYNDTYNVIINDEFVSGNTYLVSYSSVKLGTKFDLNKPCVPYMSLEIQGVGNIDKETKNIIMYFDKVSLNSIIEFTFIQDSIINVPIGFHIISNENNYVIFED